MKVFKIPKRNGGFRTIYAPDHGLKMRCRLEVPRLHNECERLDAHNVQHGFRRHRSPVTNAMVHRGWHYTLTMDIEDFFDSVTTSKVRQVSAAPLATGYVANATLFPDGAARQGLPTSPLYANIAGSLIDIEIMKMQRTGRFTNFVYTRYADDLAMSFNVPDVGDMLMRDVPDIVEHHGFRINPSKTALQCAASGRRIITGIAVDSDIHVTRKVKRKIRAAHHQMAHGIKPRNKRRLIMRQKQAMKKGHIYSLHGFLVGGLRGLEEWARLREPEGYTNSSAQPRRHDPVRYEASSPDTEIGRLRRIILE